MFQLKIIYWATVVFLILYAPRLLCWLAPFRKQKEYYNEKQNRLALIIPARNEGKAVLPLFESINRQTYEQDKFDTFVVVKEKNDPVQEYAKKVHATVYVDEKQTCKGDCLDYTLRCILEENPDRYDAYIIVDADCVLDEHFLEEMNHAMASGAQVINAKKLVKNYYVSKQDNSNIITACNGIIWTLMDDMGSRFKSDHGYTTMTVSTGILFRKELIKSWKGWIYNKTLTEDMELERDCGVQEYRTLYYDKAKIYMEEAPSHAETNKRRTRWMTGLIGSDKIYFRELLRKKGLHNRINTYYLLCLWISYLYIGFLFAMMCINLFGAILTLAWKPVICISSLKIAALCFGMIYLCFFIMTAFAMIIDWKNMKLNPFRRLELLLVHPIFYMEYIGIVYHAIVGQAPTEWEEIERVKV